MSCPPHSRNFTYLFSSLTQLYTHIHSKIHLHACTMHAIYIYHWTLTKGDRKCCANVQAGTCMARVHIVEQYTWHFYVWEGWLCLNSTSLNVIRHQVADVTKMHGGFCCSIAAQSHENPHANVYTMLFLWKNTVHYRFMVQWNLSNEITNRNERSTCPNHRGVHISRRTLSALTCWNII